MQHFRIANDKIANKNIVHYNIKRVYIKFIEINKSRKLSIILILILISMSTILDSIILLNLTRNP